MPSRPTPPDVGATRAVAYFNFDLAREIDLLLRADRLNAPLRNALLDSFGLQLDSAAAAFPTCDAGPPRADRA